MWLVVVFVARHPSRFGGRAVSVIDCLTWNSGLCDGSGISGRQAAIIVAENRRIES